MSEIHYACPSCDSTLTAPASAAGQTLPCPICGKKAVVPVAMPSTEMNLPPSRPTYRKRPISSYGLWLMILLGTALTIASSWAWFALGRAVEKNQENTGQTPKPSRVPRPPISDRKNVQIQELDERYKQLTKREDELGPQIMPLYKRYMDAKEKAEERSLADCLKGMASELNDIYRDMNHVIRDRMAMGEARPGDHQELERIARKKELLATSLDLVTLKEMQSEDDEALKEAKRRSEEVEQRLRELGRTIEEKKKRALQEVAEYKGDDGEEAERDRKRKDAEEAARPQYQRERKADKQREAARQRQMKIAEEDKQAKKLLRQALQLNARGGFDKQVRERFQQIVDKYPNTPSAKHAQLQLEKMSE